MVEHKEEFSRYLNRSGRKAAAKDYPSYLSSASRKLGIAIGPSTVSCLEDVEGIRSRLETDGTTRRVAVAPNRRTGAIGTRRCRVCAEAVANRQVKLP